MWGDVVLTTIYEKLNYKPDQKQKDVSNFRNIIIV